MPTGQQATDDTLPALGRDHEVGPAIERVHDTVLTPGGFERCHPGVQHERRHADAFVDQPGDDLGRERPTGLGVSALPGSVA